MTSVLSPPSSLTAGVAATNQAIPEMDSAVGSLLMLPLPDGSLLANLPADVNKTRTDSQLWTTTYRPLVLTTLQAVVDWTVTFDSYYNLLLPLSVQLAAGDSSAIPPFQNLLQQLQIATQAQAATTAVVAPQLVSYETLIDSDIAMLNGDQSNLLLQQQNDLRAANAFQQQADAAEAQIEKEQDKIYLNIMEGQYYIAELQNLIQALTGERQRLIDAENTALGQASQAEADAQDASSAAAQVQNYDNFLTDISSGVQQLDTGWNVLDSNFTELLSSEDITSYDLFTPALLAAVKSDWDNLAVQAAALLPAA